MLILWNQYNFFLPCFQNKYNLVRCKGHPTCVLYWRDSIMYSKDFRPIFRLLKDEIYALNMRKKKILFNKFRNNHQVEKITWIWLVLSHAIRSIFKLSSIKKYTDKNNFIVQLTKNNLSKEKALYYSSSLRTLFKNCLSMLFSFFF